MRLLLHCRSVTRFWQVTLISRGLALRFPLLCAAYTSSRIVSKLRNWVSRDGWTKKDSGDAVRQERTCECSRSPGI